MSGCETQTSDIRIKIIFRVLLSPCRERSIINRKRWNWRRCLQLLIWLKKGVHVDESTFLAIFTTWFFLLNYLLNPLFLATSCMRLHQKVFALLVPIRNIQKWAFPDHKYTNPTAANLNNENKILLTLEFLRICLRHDDPFCNLKYLYKSVNNIRLYSKLLTCNILQGIQIPRKWSQPLKWSSILKSSCSFSNSAQTSLNVCVWISWLSKRSYAFSFRFHILIFLLIAHIYVAPWIAPFSRSAWFIKHLFTTITTVLLSRF